VCGSYGRTVPDWLAVVYSVIATMFMHRWAAGKYARYKREFDPKEFPGKRWKWFPPFS
jgi:very-long-chain enoyl-CoA reductase